MAAIASSSQCLYTSLSSAPMASSSFYSVAAHGPATAQLKRFAFAQVQGKVCLVQVSHAYQGSMASALVPSDVHIFRHEFITQFRFSHSAALHPADIHIIEPIDEEHTLYEEEKGIVFLARELMARLQKLTVDSQRAFRRPRVAGQISRSH
ncbi:hypothetical protein DAEQUDRAFT_727957 [Daedalea quercina L-15889]|uniref:Uncharacterized protein n=1 Tax=Daedalea quercina L-15889 TaxID=1314783 RepID=A0A165PMB5_9APHY|nr:hypothetical protein DAEQUDRAFT_727957 [Daedalea quercina L-15889]